MSRVAIISCALCFLLYQFILVSYSNADEVPMSKLSQNVGAPTMRFLYCYSCGYRKMFEQYVNLIQQKYPFILIDGGNYDPPGIYLFIARLIGLLKMFVIVCILGNMNVFEFINRPRPGWWQWCIGNKLYACMMIFFLCNIIEGQLIQSGAFEILINDVPVWSKLESGRIPQPAELFQIIDNHLQFNKVEVNNGFAK